MIVEGGNVVDRRIYICPNICQGCLDDGFFLYFKFCIALAVKRLQLESKKEEAEKYGFGEDAVTLEGVNIAYFMDEIEKENEDLGAIRKKFEADILRALGKKSFLSMDSHDIKCFLADRVRYFLKLAEEIKLADGLLKGDNSCCDVPNFEYLNFVIQNEDYISIYLNKNFVTGSFLLKALIERHIESCQVKILGNVYKSNIIHWGDVYLPEGDLDLCIDIIRE